MPLAAMPELLDRSRAVAAFNFIQLEVAEAIVAGAEAAGHGVVLQLSQNAVAFHGSLAPAGSAALRLAEAAAVGLREFLLVVSHAKLRGATGAWVTPLAIT